MAMKLGIVFFINAVIANELIPSNDVEIPNLVTTEHPSLRNEPGNDNIVLNNQAPETHNDDVIELKREKPTPCPSTAILVPILNQLLNLLMQDTSNVNKVSKISALLKEYLKNMPDNGESIENVKVVNVGETGMPKDALRTELNYGSMPSGHVKTKIVFKYDLPSINQPQCKDVFMKLIKSAYDVYVRLAKYPTCQNAGILEDLLKRPFNMPYKVDSNNMSPNVHNVLDNQEGYSINNLLAPHHTEKYINSNYGLYQEPDKNINNLPNIYNNYKPLNPNDQAPSGMGIFEPKPNIFDKFTVSIPKPNDYDINAKKNGINPSLVKPHDVNYYRPQSHPIENLNYGGNLNLNENYNIKKESGAQNQEMYSLFPVTNDANLNINNLNIPGSNGKPPLNVLVDNINGKNQNPLDPILSVLAIAKTPDDKNSQFQEKPLELNYDKLPNTRNQNGVPINQNNYYTYLSNQDLNKLISPYGTPVNSLTNQLPNQNLYLQSYPKDYTTQYAQPFYKYISSQYGVPINKINLENPYLQKMYSNYLNKLGMLPNLQKFHGVPNGFKLDPSVNADVIELTFVLKHTTPLIYQPSYFVKFRIPYSTYLYNLNNLLLTKPHLKINPLKLYQELIGLSNVSDMSPSLKGYKKEDILNLTYKNGEFVKAKLLRDDTALNEQLRIVQNLNSGIGAADIMRVANKNIGLLNFDTRNSTKIEEETYRKVIAPYYDLGSSGIGFNSDSMSRYNKQPLSSDAALRQMVSNSSLTDTTRSKRIPIGLPIEKSNHGNFSVGLNA